MAETTKKRWTPEQALAIERRDCTMLLSAAAGSGKTAVLTQRIIESLTDPARRIPLSRILAVTFTRSAAAELRARIGAALGDAVLASPDDEFLASQLRLLPTASISTIDSFCIGILRRFAAEAGVSEGFRILDEQEANLLRLSLLSDLVAEGYAGLVPGVSAEEFCRLSYHLVGVRQESTLPELLHELTKKLESLTEGVDALKRWADEYLSDSARPLLDTKWGGLLLDELRGFGSHYEARLSPLLDALRGDADLPAAYLDALGTYVNFARDLASPVRSYPHLSALAETSFPTLKPGKKHSEESAPLLEAVKATCSSLREDLAKRIRPLFYYDEAAWATLLRRLGEECLVLWRLLSCFEGRFLDACHARASYDFATVNRLTYSLLLQNGERTEVAHALAQEYDAVCVDEYQDVNPLQHAVFEAISGERARFLVGDIKQSIYRFRHAEPDIFAALRRAFPPLGEEDHPCVCHFMSYNFRSDRAVIGFINRVFSTVFGAAGDSIGYREDADNLRASRSEEGLPPAFTPVVALFGREHKDTPATPEELPRAKDLYERDMQALEAALEGDSPDGEEDEDDTVTPEVAWVASQIADLLRNGTRRDGTPLHPGDIAILMRSANSKYAPYREALARLGIDSCKPKDTDFFSCPEVLLALALLNTVDNPLQDIPLSAVLCSPLYGFSSDDLTLVRRASPEAPSLYDALVLYCEAHPDFSRGTAFLCQLARFREVARTESPDKLLRLLFAETPLMSIAGADGGGGEANLKLLYHYARNYGAASGERLYRFIRFINSQIESGATFSPPKGGDAADRVVISTVHGSKGLEYPVVFVCGCGAPFSSADLSATLLCDGKLGLALRLREEGSSAIAENPVRRLAERAVTDADRQEEMRLLYVALTRAQERLYVTGSVARRSYVSSLLERVEAARAHKDRYAFLRLPSYMAWVLAALGDDPSVATLLVNPEPSPVEDVAEDAGRSAPTDEEIRAQEALLRRRLDFRYPFAHLAGLPKKLSVSKVYPALLDGTEEEAVPLAPPDGEDGDRPEKWRRMPEAYAGAQPPAPTDRGIATHLFLQFCDFGALAERGVEEELARLEREKFLSPETVRLIRREELRIFRASSLLSDLLGARLVRREFRFNTYLPAALFTEDPARRAALEGENLFVQGVIDALIETEEGELILVDYKTDRLTREELESPQLAARKLVGRHGTQLRYYALAAELIFGKRPTHTYLYALQSGLCYEVPDEPPAP
ncbi:MAG: UvrD-helicase domain-containing protein [Clostridia bacterium]|nr:UvrD-helicase domain-containing protein [Clostridia bacterium]